MKATLILIDGLRPDAIDVADCPTLTALRNRCAATMNAVTVMPSITLPCHFSLFHSVPPARHGITTNLYTPMARPLPGLFDVASAAGKRCAIFYNWEQLRDLGRPGSLHGAGYVGNSAVDPHGDDEVVDLALAYRRKHDPDLLFVYLGTVDEAGHKYGWMSDGYLEQIGRVDHALETLLDALDSSTSVLLQSDHGGHDRSHGTPAPEDMTIPWMIAGPGVREGRLLEEPVSILDSAPTLAHLLQVAPHPSWEGRVVTEAFLSTDTDQEISV